jgi:hypothetical protein
MREKKSFFNVGCELTKVCAGHLSFAVRKETISFEERVWHGRKWKMSIRAHFST